MAYAGFSQSVIFLPLLFVVLRLIWEWSFHYFKRKEESEMLHTGHFVCCVHFFRILTFFTYKLCWILCNGDCVTCKRKCYCKEAEKKLIPHLSPCLSGSVYLFLNTWTWLEFLKLEANIYFCPEHVRRDFCFSVLSRLYFYTQILDEDSPLPEMFRRILFKSEIWALLVYHLQFAGW